MSNMLENILARLTQEAEANRVEIDAILEEARASLRSLESEEERRRTSGFRMYREKVENS